MHPQTAPSSNRGVAVRRWSSFRRVDFALWWEHVRGDAPFHAFAGLYTLVGLLVAIAAGVPHKLRRSPTCRRWCSALQSPCCCA
jgi:hypothetical protein